VLPLKFFFNKYWYLCSLKSRCHIHAAIEDAISLLGESFSFYSFSTYTNHAMLYNVLRKIFLICDIKDLWKCEFHDLSNLHHIIQILLKVEFNTLNTLNLPPALLKSSSSVLGYKLLSCLTIPVSSSEKVWILKISSQNLVINPQKCI
jgi:hypothetical protein